MHKPISAGIITNYYNIINNHTKEKFNNGLFDILYKLLSFIALFVLIIKFSYDALEQLLRTVPDYSVLPQITGPMKVKLFVVVGLLGN